MQTPPVPRSLASLAALALRLTSLTAAVTASAQGAFLPSHEVDVDSPITSVVHGDWNGDGAPDVASAGNHVAISLNDGAGRLQAAAIFPGVTGLSHLTADDVDGDGNLDLLAFEEGPDRVNVYLGNGDGTFALLTPISLSLPVPLGPGASLTTGDVDGDLRPDLVVATATSQAMQLALNTGTSPFFAFVSVTGGTSLARSVELADVDGDLDLDLVWTTTTLLRLKLNEGTGAFAGPVFDVASLSTGTDLVSADFDGNGLADFAANRSGPTPAESLYVMLNQGGGVFATRTYGTGTSYTARMGAGDLDADGDVDLALSDTDGTGGGILASLVYNDGAGCFASATCAPAGILPAGESFDPSVVTSVSATHAVAIVDLDSDSRADMVWAGQYGLGNQTKLYAHLNATPLTGTYPGTGEDLELRSSLSAQGQPVVYSGGGLFDVKTAAPGELLRLRVESKAGAFDFAPLLLLANLGPTVPGLPPAPVPGIALDLNSVLILANGLGSPFPSALVLPEGWDWSTPIPPGLAGNSLFLQTIAFPNAAAAPFQPAVPANGIFATTDAHEIRF